MDWQESHDPTPERQELARLVLEEVLSGVDLTRAVRRHPLPAGGYLPKAILVQTYQALVESGEWPPDARFLALIRMKPMRTLSGVTTVTVLTKPYPCPGKCIFCPTDARMPKSYLPDEPGAKRGLQNEFDPYRQVATRLRALLVTGHPTDKIELLILGGTFTSYRRDYQAWFVQRCFDALNDNEFRRPRRSPAAQPKRCPPQRRAGDRDPPGRNHPIRNGLAARPGRDQGADGRPVAG